MAKRKPKPATAGEKIADEYAKKLTGIGVPMLHDVSLSRSIDRAVARAVRKERERCMGIIANARDATPYTSVSKVTISRVMCSIEEGEQP